MELFFKDNHFEDDIKFVNGSDEIANWILPLIKKYYGKKTKIDDIQLEEIFGSNINSGNYRIGSFYIKTIKHDHDKAYVLDFPKIAKSLSQAEIPTSSFIPSDSGNEIVDHYSNRYKTNFYIYVQEYIHSSFFSGTAQEMKEAMSALRKLNRAEYNIKNSKIQSPYLQWNPSNILNNVKKILDNKNELDEFDQFAMSKLNTIEKSLKNLEGTINELSIPSETISHYDFHPHNLLFNNGKLSSVIDLESFVKIQPELSTAFALFKLGRKCLSKEFMTADEFKKMAKENQFGLNKLLPYAKVELIRRTLFILDLHYLQDNKLWDSDICKQIIGIDEVEVLFS